MTRRTLMKKIRAFQVVKGVTGKMELKPREGSGLAPAMPRQAFEIDCGQAGMQTVMVAHGQMINPTKLCKRLGGTFVPPKPTPEAAAIAEAQQAADKK